jgi:5-methylcytosine-specific restriction enzyme subunit McrC
MPLEVTYDEFSVDTAENQILRTALRRMLGVPRLPAATSRRLLHLDGRLSGVAVLPRRAPLPRWYASRLNEHYQPALRLAEVVLRHASAEPSGDGQVRVAAFVVPMWRVFEDFVTTAVSEALARRPGRTIPQRPDHLDEPAPGRRPGIPMAVDLVHVDGDGRPQIIIDAKYKVSDASGRYPNADHYQMLAYCTALGVPRAWLVYAQGSGRPVGRKVRNSDVRIVEYPLDLSAPPSDLLRQISTLADMAWEQRARCGGVQLP